MIKRVIIMLLLCAPAYCWDAADLRCLVSIRTRGLWTPAEIATEVWYDAADTNTIILSSGAITNWLDKSGNGRSVTQATPLNRPTLVANFTNGLPSVLFDNTDVLSWVGGSNISFNGIQCVFVGRQQSNAAPYSGFVQWIRTTVGNDQFNIREDNDLPSMQVEVNTGTSGDQYAGSSRPLAFDTIFMCGLSHNGTNVVLYVDGGNSSYTTVATGTMAVNRINLGVNAFVGNIAEVVFVRSQNSAVREKVEGYLAWKWGMQSVLPSVHPYKQNPP